MDAEIGIENLILARDVLTALNVRYFLMDGTLLGLARNGCFIEWDNDIDVGVLAEDFTVASFGRFASLMMGKGFSRKYVDGKWGKCFVSHWIRKNVMVDICFYFRRGDRRIAHMFDSRYIYEVFYPARLIETLSSVDFYGKTFMAPKYKEEVLAHAYGNWKIPRRGRDWVWNTSPLHITRRTRRPIWKSLQLRLSYRLRRIWSAMGSGAK